MRAPRATALGALLAVGTLLATALGCHPASQEDLATTNAVPVVVATARLGDLRASVRATGVVTPAPGAELAVVAPAPARIAELPAAEGDRVRRGALLVRFDAPNLQADVAARRADLSRGQARLAAAQHAVERLTGLFERGVAAQKEVEDARKEAADAQADVATATSALRAAQDVASRVVVRAPFDGVVSARLHNPGDLVDASASDPVLRLVDPSRLQVEAAVPLADLVAVAVGQPVRIAGAGMPMQALGTVAARPAMADPATGAARVRVAIRMPALLSPNAPVQVEILTVEHHAVVVIPAAAVVQEGPQAFAYVVTPDKHAHRRALQLGIVGGAEVEVRAGVEAGEQVIVQGQTGLPDDAEVTPSAQPPPAGAGANGTGAGGAGDAASGAAKAAPARVPPAGAPPSGAPSSGAPGR